MLRRIIFGSFLVVAFCVSNTLAQAAYTPAKGSVERTAILNALRAPVEKELKQKVQFSTDTFRVQGSWAFINGSPQNASGGKPDYRNTNYQESITAGAFDNNFQALLKKTGGKWKVVTYLIGCTDVCWLPWAEDYKTPKAIFPIQQ